MQEIIIVDILNTKIRQTTLSIKSYHISASLRLYILDSCINTGAQPGYFQGKRDFLG